ncbi:MAG: dephospho-CoA kinase [Lachnospiraceae bacterium]|nr:dephospho-CoA kinase [Lachnospiraceae bacterium]
MKVIGVTGGVGSGKSRVLAILKEDFGAKIILADEVARQLEEPGQPGLIRLTRYFGKEILEEDGTLDRVRLATIIFRDEKALEAVNRMIHPLVWETIKEMVSSMRTSRNVGMSQNGRLPHTGGKLTAAEESVVTAAALEPAEQIFVPTPALPVTSASIPEAVCLTAVESALFNEQTRSICDQVWLIDTSDENRIRRLMENRGYTREKCISIIKNQKSREEFLEFCDVVINNDGSIEQVRQKVHEQLGKQGISR